jgi:NAD(P)-dependent dehydrogenase (short-subunit alcohol dehydrogenase family)
MPLPEPPPLGAHALPLGCFERETVVVTGGGTGLGKAIALEFARLGARVAILSRREEHRAAGVAVVEAAGAKALGVACDSARTWRRPSTRQGELGRGVW